MSDSQAQRDWVERVLSVTLPDHTANGDLAAQWQAARDEWLQASAAADAQIAALRDALLASGDETTRAIAQNGLAPLAKGLMAPVAAAVEAVDVAEVAPVALRKLGKVIGAVTKLLDSDPRVAACDDNPFGVAVSLRPTLGRALAALQRISAADA